MSEVRFIWHEEKLAKVQRDHRVSYGEAVDAVLDERGYHAPDKRFWERFIAVGKTKQGRLLAVVFVEDEEEPPETFRLITAFDATKEHINGYPG